MIYDSEKISDDKQKATQLALRSLLDRTFLLGKVKNPPRNTGIHQQTNAVFIKMTVSLLKSFFSSYKKGKFKYKWHIQKSWR